jgi:hypothetical protein
MGSCLWFELCFQKIASWSFHDWARRGKMWNEGAVPYGSHILIHEHEGRRLQSVLTGSRRTYVQGLWTRLLGSSLKTFSFLVRPGWSERCPPVVISASHPPGIFWMLASYSVSVSCLSLVFPWFRGLWPWSPKKRISPHSSSRER